MDFLVCPMRNTSSSYHRDHTFSRILLLEWHNLTTLDASLPDDKAAKTIGCTYGGPVEFLHNGTMIQDYRCV